MRATGGTATAIMDAAETRIRTDGYHGFSFRDLGAAVGISSASVHHHFPTKPALAAAVARRYADRVLDRVGAAAPADRIDAWRAVFRSALRDDGRMCLCGVLAAEADGLPAEVAAEARRFFARAIDGLIEGGMSRAAALAAIARLEGAMLLARILDDPKTFDEATSG